MTENIKKISDWQVLTPSGWQDFEGVKKVSKPYTLKITLEDDSSIICSGGHQLYVLDKETNESAHLFADLVQPFVMSIETKDNGFQTVVDVEKIEKEQELFDLVNVAHGYEYYTNDIVSHNCAHVEGIDELWLGIWPTLSTGGSAILISSPSGVGTLFHKLWVGAKDGEDGVGKPNPGKGTNSFYRVELPWTVHPERDEAWFQSQRDEILPAKGERGVLQELCCSFSAGGENFLSGDVIEAMELQMLAPIATYGDRGNVWIWKYAEPGHKYIASADVSRGDADDFSTIIVIDTNSDEIVCDYQGKCPPEKLAELLLDLGGKYNNALLCPELNSFGMIVATVLKKSSYPNVYYDKIHKNAYMGYTTADVADELPGWTTGVKNRDEMLAKLETKIRTKCLKIYSSRIIEEFKTFIWKNNKAQAMKGYADDLVIALAIGNSLYEASGVNAWDDKKLTMAMLSGMSKGTVTMSPIGSASGFGQKSTVNMPPIMTSEGVRTVAQLQDFQNKRDVAKQGPQNMRNPYYSQWSWVLNDSYGPPPEKK